MTAHRFPLVAIATLLVAGCDPRIVPTSDLSPREIQTLSGVWQGRSSLHSGGRDCPTGLLWTLRVGGGNVDGEIVDAATPRAAPAKFATFLDYDGSLHTAVRPGGRDSTVRGTFSRDSFGGELKSATCSYLVRLRRAASS